MLVQQLIKLFKCWSLNVEATPMNIRWLKFHFELTINVETTSTLNRRNSVNVVWTFFCQCWNNVDTCTSSQLSFSTKYQRWNNVDQLIWWNISQFVVWLIKLLFWHKTRFIKIHQRRKIIVISLIWLQKTDLYGVLAL